MQPAIECLCLWSDLLGFGAAFERGNWALDSEDIQGAAARIARIERFVFRSNSPAHEYVLVLNDGIARSLDLPPAESRALRGLLQWLQSALTNHWQINAFEQDNGQPGMRSVLCVGQRMGLRDATKTTLSQVFAGENAAIALAGDISVYSPLQFQLNLAFSKAYIIEGLGKAKGLGGPALFVEGAAIVGLNQLINASEESTDPDRILVESSIQARDDALVFLVTVSHRGIQKESLAIEFDAQGIDVNHRGIVAEMYRVVRFNPLDEGSEFWFDFTDYQYDQSLRIEDPVNGDYIDPKGARRLR